VSLVAVAVAYVATEPARQQRRALREQRNAIAAAQEQDARNAAQAEASAAIAANAATADAKRRRRVSALGAGQTAAQTLGGGSNAPGMPRIPALGAVYSPSSAASGTALGTGGMVSAGGSITTSSGGTGRLRTPE